LSLPERPYVVVWYNYTDTLEQCRKYIESLPERIGKNRDWKLIVHAHPQKVDQCNKHCGVINKPNGGLKWTMPLEGIK
jgi:hypothetical protein